ncbi:phosphoglucosamine mutase [Striga asiatica]|uniref:Phosphoglucosamine mutase n=1 Tax=Striga asiatica TaxID=4170 RepID=A0A5A7QA18_STRAF|nr:phosphoglucosamine mutase [Striga asiatica]
MYTRVLLPPHYFEQHHPITVNVRFIRDGRAREPLWRQVTARPSHGREQPRLLGAQQLRQPKVGYLHGFVVEEDVLGLHVAVNDLVFAARVKVREPSGSPERDLVPLPPLQEPLAVFSSEQRAVERAAVHELVNEKPLPAVRAEPFQPHEVDVVDFADDGNLGEELLVTARPQAGDLFHRDFGSIAEGSLVDSAEPSGTDLVLEAFGHGRQLVVVESDGKSGNGDEVDVIISVRGR